jgi:glucose/arabinose dehydrogenase
MLTFGPDGNLYIANGDMGDSTNSPKPDTKYGKILRVDVGTAAPATPNLNPTVVQLGLRNPWRFSFDRATGDMWIGDVGQGNPRTVGFEEVDYVPADQLKGKNFGWSMWEGVETGGTITHCYGNFTCTNTGMTFPQIERDHSGAGWAAIIGGDVYRGTCYPDMVGTYFFGDNSKRQLSIATVNGATVTATDLPAPTNNWPAGIASIHKAAGGELFLTTASGTTTNNGRIYHIEAGP